MPQREQVRAYSAMEESELAEYVAAIESSIPDVTLSIERMSTSVLHSRLIEEGTQGRWDIIFGWALTQIFDPAILQLLGPLRDVPATALPDGAHDKGGTWLCPSAFLPAFCVNRGRLADRGIPIPLTWRDLAMPCFADEIVLPDPRYSGAGFLHMTALLQSVDALSARELLRGVAANRPRVVRSAYAPCEAVLNGTAAIGVTVTTAVQALVNRGSALEAVVPADAAAYEPEVFAMRAGSPRAAAAQRILGWTLSAAACDRYRHFGKIVLVKTDSAGIAIAHQDNLTVHAIDARKAHHERAIICSTWTGIFAGEE
jgi:iron(III) transport system substrate-binding protein